MKIGVINKIAVSLTDEEKELLPPSVVYAISIAEHELRIKHGDDIKFELVTDASTSVGRAAVEYANSPARKHLYSLIEQTETIEIQSLDALVKFGGYSRPDDSEKFRSMYPNVILIDFAYPVLTKHHK